ncbi:ABC transporter ATP-binding protein [Enhygromyxa salina]|uniref:Putative siderophore transport system ATP-binding protein YusV n=1 Tax=Enhygromyxa salina TaxID=215803 RepID=A0A2S9XR84_9BACT|nr:ABC transporter ATP-binding protein [Enhygromyxa salina]PRP95250.1 putative siderophore transport system ATP-binding protein YusV [Enhygromyxa salina]
MKLRAEGLGLRVAGRWLIRGCSFELTPGTVSVIVGPNGSGKTTLLRALLGLIQPDEGKVWLDGSPLARHSLRARARACAWLPQRTELPWGMPANELVMLGRAPHLSAFAGPGRADELAVTAALARVEASDLSVRDVRTLSGGELQRVLLARLLATEAPLLLLDEPTTALDVGHALALLELTRELAAAGHGVLMSLHELELARRYGDQALLLRGDDAGGYVLGSVNEVLTPAVISEVFAVGAKIIAGELRFHSTVT